MAKIKVKKKVQGEMGGKSQEKKMVGAMQKEWKTRPATKEMLDAKNPKKK